VLQSKALLVIARRLYLSLEPVLRRVPGGMRIAAKIGDLAMPLFPNPVRYRDLILHYDRQCLSGLIWRVVSDSYEPETVALFERLLRPGMGVMDIGANIGFFSLIAGRLVSPSGKVYAFEPHPDVACLLEKNVRANKLEGIVLPVNKALSNRMGFATLYPGKWNSGASSFYPSDNTSREGVRVEMTTVDAFLAERGWPPIHFVKLDVEGHECAVLEGMRETLRCNPDLSLVMEFAPATLRAAGREPESVFELWVSMGFRKFTTVEREPRPLNTAADLTRYFASLPCFARRTLRC